LPRRGSLSPQVAFAMVLRETRIALGLTQADLEDDNRMDKSYISKLELGKHEITIDGIMHLARKLEMRPGELMDAVQRKMDEHRK